MRQRPIRETAADNNLNVVHCAMLGDGMVGKTCLTLSYCKGYCLDEYNATTYHEYRIPLRVAGDQCLLVVHDTAGQSDFDHLRSYAYMESDVLVLCFSVGDRASFTSIQDAWVPEIKKLTKRKQPIILVGTQTDLRLRSWNTSVTSEEGERLAKTIGADLYLECSAKYGSGLDDLFDNIIDCALRQRKRKNSLLKRLISAIA